MTDINFYVGKQDSLDGRMKIACRLIQMALARNMKTHVHTDSARSAQKLDSLLWTLDDQSFIPHAVVSENTPPHAFDKITISHDFEPMTDCDYLINLSIERPHFFSRFKKMAEVIDQNEEILTAGRKRYAFYRERGYTLEYHKL